MIEPLYKVEEKLAGLIAPLVSQSSETVEAEFLFLPSQSMVMKGYVVIHMQTNVAMSTCRMLAEQVYEVLATAALRVGTKAIGGARIEFVSPEATFYVVTYRGANRIDEYTNWEASHE